MDWVFPLITLTLMEIVLGIDNIIFIAILAGRLPKEQQAKARSLGLLAALVMRILLLLSLGIVMKLTTPIFHLTDLGVPEAWVTSDHAAPAAEHPADEHASAGGHAPPPGANDVDGISGRDLMLLLGGLLLVGKTVLEIHHKIEGAHGEKHAIPAKVSFISVLAQIALFDIIFSIDSVLTAIGMAREIWVMVLAVILSIGVMLIFAGSISAFVDRHPTIKILALSFLILIGVLLIAEGVGTHLNKGYVYFAMAFSLVVEMINMRIRKGQGATPTILEHP